MYLESILPLGCIGIKDVYEIVYPEESFLLRKTWHYCGHISLAFESIENILRDVAGGYWLKYLHANGASVFFALVYLHMARGLYYQSYQFSWLWLSGVVIFLLMIMTAFLGYVLPWGQMSYWGATVITNLFSVISDTLVQALWGGYSVDNPTLNRFYSLHYLLPFILLVVVCIHLILLHEFGSSNPSGTDPDCIRFHPYFTIKDMITLIIYIGVLVWLVCWVPNWLSHPDNNIQADPLVTPLSIVP
ncbi:cytochrome b-like, partial [Periplaneta americana]